MNQWEIYDYPFEEQGSHQTARPHVKLKRFHFLLDQADGLDNSTLVRCDHIHELRRDLMGQRRGVVSFPRRLPLFRKVLECYECPPR